MEERLLKLYDKDNSTTYKSFLELEKSANNSNELYSYFGTILKMLSCNKSYVRVRGFKLLCALAQWDKDNKLDKNISLILSELDDDKPTSVRQCLATINTLLLYKPNLANIVNQKLSKIDYDKYQETMAPLIKKDVDNLLNKF